MARVLLMGLLVVVAGGALADSPSAACLACHPSPGLMQRLRAGEKISADGEVARFEGSAHAALGCVSCHPGTQLGPHKPKPVKRACQDCHSEGGAARRHSLAPVVDQLHTRSSRFSPECQTCHGHHQIGRPAASGRPDDPAAATYWHNVPTLCGRCHTNPKLMGSAPQVADYLSSVHGRIALAAGPGRRAAVCTDCHTVHSTSQAPATSILTARPQLPQTCGKCHPAEADQYAHSIHGLGLAAGIKGVPVCTDCHGEHNIQAPTNPEASTSSQHIVAMCGKCHGNAAFVRLYKLPGARVTTYEQSYHGVANRYGRLQAANCVSCHGAHDILPASNPSSRVNPSRLAETCGRCHPGAGKSFPIGRVHLMPSSRQGWALLVLRRAYQAFVCLTLLGFLGYILLDLVTYWRLRRAGVLEQFERRLTALPAPPGDALLRMTRIERWQHNLLIVAFTLLALTGFPVVFPRSLFAQAVMALCGGDHGRAFLHRVSAVGLVALAVVHGLWLVGTPRGRKILRRLLPAWADVRNAWETALLFFGRTTERPRFGWFSFLEKFEYFALCWGTFIMTLSGVVMWFVDWSLSRFPKWALDASEIFHRWEAILAVLAILVWHLYHTLWKPGVYPGNHAWLTGHLTVEEFARDHPLEYEAATGRSLVEPKPPERAPKAAEKASEEADEGRG